MSAPVEIIVRVGGHEGTFLGVLDLETNPLGAVNLGSAVATFLMEHGNR